VFNTTYNPERVRVGSRILHQRLKGPSVAAYYPPRIGTISHLRKLYPEFEVIDEEEEDWLEHLNVAKSRGKGAPKKKRTAAGTHLWGRLKKIGRAILTVAQNRRSSTRRDNCIDAAKTRFLWLESIVYQVYYIGTTTALRTSRTRCLRVYSRVRYLYYGLRVPPNVTGLSYWMLCTERGTSFNLLKCTQSATRLGEESFLRIGISTRTRLAPALQSPGLPQSYSSESVYFRPQKTFRVS
jgi:small subunit ribosomal protein S33